MDAQINATDLDIGPAVAKLRFFRFAEYILVFLAIMALAWFVDLVFGLAVLGGLETKFGSGFSPGWLNLCLAALAAAILAGFPLYRAAGRLRAGPMRRHRMILLVAGAAFLMVGIAYAMQAGGMMHRANVIRATAGLAAAAAYDPMFEFNLSIQPPAVQERMRAEMAEKLRAKSEAVKAEAAAIEALALPVITRAEVSIAAAVAAVLGLWGLITFAQANLGSRTTPMTYLDAVERARRKQTPPRARGTPINRTRGALYFLAALGLIAGQFLLPELPFGLGVILAVAIGALSFVALFRAKQYFQVSADSLLGKDKRPPILFLRSFSDDPKVSAAAGMTHEGLAALIDLSVETRLANHFMQFGPFIAVGSPQEAIPQIGAARVKLADDEWQDAVTAWMQHSSAIVIYAGTTHWVGWELKRIIEGGWTDKLIVLFPPVLPFPGFWQTSWLKRQKPDMLKRFEQTKAAFKDTKWAEAWAAVSEPETVLAARFEDDGTIAVTRSLRRSKDAYDFAAKRAHLAILGALPAETAPQPGSSATGGAA